MKTIYIGRGMKFTSALQSVFGRKLKRAFAPFDVSDVRTTIAKDGVSQSVAIHLVYAGGQVDAKVSGENVYQIVDKCIAKARAQIVKSKEKRHG